MEVHDDTNENRDSIDEIDFVPPPVAFGRLRPGQRPMEPKVVRSLGVAVVVGAVLGTAVFYFKPTPRSASANPIPMPMTIEPRETTPAPAKKPVELFELPEWNENDPPRPS